MIIVDILLFFAKSIIKVLTIILVILLIRYGICIIQANGITGSWAIFKETFILKIVLLWVALWIKMFKRGDVRGILLGLLIFYSPIITIAMLTPDPGIELMDNKGNIWTLMKK